jgi:hypothetical protein
MNIDYLARILVGILGRPYPNHRITERINAIERSKVQIMLLTGYSESAADRIVKRCIRLSTISIGDVIYWLEWVETVAQQGDDIEVWLEGMEAHYKVFDLG